MRKIYQYILMAVAVVATASCTNELDEALQPAGNVQFVVSDFPAYGTDTRAIGTQDAGKTAWAEGDEILVTLTSQKYGTKAATLTYNGSTWNIPTVNFTYLENEKPTVSAIYAPCYQVTENGEIQLKEDMQLGMTEYISANCTIEGSVININFEGVSRTYSRLRIAAVSDQTLAVTPTDFTPAGATKVATAAYTLTTDNNGNAFLYGTFAEGASVTVNTSIVRNGQTYEKTIADYTFTAEKYPNGTVKNTSYTLDARNGYEEESSESSESVTTYKVYDADGLLAWNKAAQDNLSLNLVLMKDIDMSDAGEWTPVGDRYNPYVGIINGNGYTIRNITLSDLTDDVNVYIGFVGCMGNENLGGEMKDIKFDSSTISMPKSYPQYTGEIYVGIVANMFNSTMMTNVSVTGAATWEVDNAPNSGYVYAGVLVGLLSGYNPGYSTVKNCHVENGIKLSVNADDADLYVGGIAGYSAYSYLLGCTSAATISVTGSVSYEGFVGGIMGYGDYGSNTNGCVYYGDLEAALTDGTVMGIGGIAGGVYAYSSDFNVVGCYVTGEVTGDTGNAAPVGAIVGYTGNNNDIVNSVKSCYWSGNDGLNAFGDYSYPEDYDVTCLQVNGTTVTWDTAKKAMNDALNEAGAGVEYESSTENEKLPLVPML